jgi:hypothetical protein
MRIFILVSLFSLASCYTPPYDFSYENEKMMYGSGQLPGSDFPSIPAYSQNPNNSYPGGLGANIRIPADLQLPSNQPQSPSAAPYGNSNSSQQKPQSPYSNPYANPYGYAPYGSAGKNSNNSVPVNTNTNKSTQPVQNNNQKSPYSGYVGGKNDIFMNNPGANGSSAPNYSNNINITKPNYNSSSNINKSEQADRYRGLTDTNKYQVIDTNVFSEKDRDRFGLMESDSFSPNNNFEQYRSMYDNKNSKKTQQFVDSLEGNLLDEMIQNDPISNGFGLENIPKY